MRLLLDTHVVLWAAGNPDRLPRDLLARLRDPVVSVSVSAVTACELAIKQSLGKIRLPGPVDRWLPEAVDRMAFGWLSLEPIHGLALARLPWIHRDPFDRMLVAQAQSGFTLVTSDARLADYSVDVWVT